MAQFTFDTNDPDDVRLLQRLVSAGIVTRPDADGNFDLTGAVDSFLSALGQPALDLVYAFIYQTRLGATTLSNVAAGMNLPEGTVKSRKMGLGRTISRVRREYPGFDDPIVKHEDKGSRLTSYTMDPEVREAMDQWFQARAEAMPEPPATSVAGAAGA